MWKIFDLFFSEQIFYFFVGLIDKLWQFILTKHDFDILTTLLSVKIATGFGFHPLLHWYLPAIIVTESIEDKRTRSLLVLRFLGRRGEKLSFFTFMEGF